MRKAGRGRGGGGDQGRKKALKSPAPSNVQRQLQPIRKMRGKTPRARQRARRGAGTARAPRSPGASGPERRSRPGTARPGPPRPRGSGGRGRLRPDRGQPREAEEGAGLGDGGGRKGETRDGLPRTFDPEPLL